MSTYAPGTVAIATVQGVKGVRVMRLNDCWGTFEERRGWADCLVSDSRVTDIRPLLVLDVDRYVTPSLLATWLRANAVCGSYSVGGELADQIDAQIRPKIEEPTGLAAVVKDSEGDKWIRHDSLADCEDGPLCIPWRNVKTANTARWDQIDAVEVLSKGLDA